jgi:tRNA(fMet)-specific endonuclease VapC
MRNDAKALSRLESSSRANVFVPQVVCAEVAYGIERMPSGKKKDKLRDSFKLLRNEVNRVEWTDEVTDEFGRIKATLESEGTRLEDFDVAIAAHAISMDCILVTSNAKHMARIKGLRWEDWSSA